jgi:hypothetical protein
MGVIFEAGYSLPGADQPLTNARIAHSGTWYAGTPAASSTATGYFAASPNNSLTYELWKPSSVTATWELDLGSAVDVDYCCIAAHTMGTNGNSVQVQYYTGSAWADLTPVTAVSDDMPIMCIFSTENAQRFRISVTGGTAPTIGVIRFGEAMQMDAPIFGGHSPLDYGRITESRAAYSMSGAFLGRSKQRQWLATSFEWTHLNKTWVEANWSAFQKAGYTEPFFIAWRPDDFSEVGYCQTENVPAPQFMGVRAYMTVGLQVTALGYD